MRLKILAGCALAFVTTTAVNATILIDSTNAFAPSSYAVGTGSLITNLTSYINAQGAAAGSLSDTTLVSSSTALLLNLRLNGSAATALSATEVTNLQAFIASGKRVLIIGENSSSFSGWDQSFINAVGNSATYSPIVTNGSVTPVVTNSLTAGVTSVAIGGGGSVLGGTELFSQNVAATFGASDNVLLVMDVNALSNNSGGTDQFQKNIATWLGGSVASDVPEPASWAMMLVGFGTIGFGMRSRQRKVGVSFS
jgi:hypothetical protein